MRVSRLLTTALSLPLATLLTAACSDDSGTEPTGTTTATGSGGSGAAAGTAIALQPDGGDPVRGTLVPKE